MSATIDLAAAEVRDIVTRSISGHSGGGDAAALLDSQRQGAEGQWGASGRNRNGG
jgi:hypothetical protein